MTIGTNEALPQAAAVPDSDAATRLASAAAIVVFGLGTMVLAGWMLRIDVMKSLVPGLIIMLPNTAVGFITSGSCAWLFANEHRTGLAPVRQALGVFVLTFGSLTLIERLADVNFGFDTLLFRDQLAAYPYRPLGRMATNSAISLTLAGIALVLLERRSRSAQRLARVAATLGLAIGALALLGYLYGVRPLYAVDRAAGMALTTALGFTLLHFGLLVLHGKGPARALLTGDDLGAVVFRRMLPATVGVPVVLGWIWLFGRRTELFSREGGVSLFVALTIAALITFLFITARVVRNVDRHRASVLLSEATARHDADVARKQAEAASTAKSNFLAVISHELRTPLNAIIGYQSLMSEGISGPISAEQKHQLERINVGATHLLGLIDQILTLNRIDAQHERARLEVLDLSEVIRDVVATIAPLAAAKGLTLHTELPGTPPQVLSDPGKLRQVLLNLLSNAVKFTHLGGITVRVRLLQEQVAIDVTDTGIGISKENLPRIYEDFWQAENATTRTTGGAGLGLGLSRRLARLLGGDISVESAEGEGTTFTVTLPLQLRLAADDSARSINTA